MVLDFDNLYKKYDLRIKGLLHIGAHWGGENKIYQKYGIENKIFFEPLPHVFKKLQKNVKDGILINKALGSKAGTASMYVEYDNDSQSSSLLKPKTHLIDFPTIKFTDRIQVDIIRLDDYAFDYNDYNFINIDVQGYELEVFKGAVNTLKHIDYIITEINNGEVYEKCAQVEELDEFLQQYDFERVETDWMTDSWGDAFYIKSKINKASIYCNAVGEMLPYERYKLHNWILDIKPIGILEVGSGLGGSTGCMAEAIQKLGIKSSIYTCDPKCRPDNAFLGQYPFVEYQCMRSDVFIQDIIERNLEIDFVFFDGPDISDIALNDIQVLEKYITSGTYFCMHDWEFVKRGFDNSIAVKAQKIRPYIEQSEKWDEVEILSGLFKNDNYNKDIFDSVGLCLYKFVS